MPPSARTYMKQRCKKLHGAIDRALYHLGEMRKQYHPDYPEQVKMIELMAFTLVEYKDLIDRFREDYV